MSNASKEVFTSKMRMLEVLQRSEVVVLQLFLRKNLTHFEVHTDKVWAKSYITSNKPLDLGDAVEQRQPDVNAEANISTALGGRSADSRCNNTRLLNNIPNQLQTNVRQCSRTQAYVAYEPSKHAWPCGGQGSHRCAAAPAPTMIVT
ncbi:hypothetical protein EVAR_86078_1 [Eumeta japonica]|uniref:Uncharacterized protein n=1 Tax=Eumeta variegata TaxID=151549 RepID=A0A4C1UL17_EUMVA|nr:hypothetical protein EVAR_86078_1 [Eumeta japonica]